MKAENQQIASTKAEDKVTYKLDDIGVQSPINLNLKVDKKQAVNLEKEKEDDQRCVEDENEDDDITVLAFWFGDHKLDVLTAEEWLGSVQRAKVQSKWNDLVTMHKVVNALFGDAFSWFLNLVTPFIVRYNFKSKVHSLILIR